MARNWSGVLAVEGVQTGDGRYIEPGAITWRELPFALKPGHDSEVAIGNVMTVSRVGNEIRATGVIDDQSPMGGDMVRMMDAGTAPMGNRWGLSIEPEDVAVDIVDTAPQQAEGDVVIIASAHGSGQMARAVMAVLTAASGDPMPDGEVIYQDSTDQVVQRFTKLKIAAVATVPVQALEGAYLELDAVDMAVMQPHDWVDANGDGLCDVCGLDRAGHDQQQQMPDNAPPAAAVTAAVFGAPVKPPRAWFEEPEPEEGDERLVPQYDIDTGEYIGDAVPLTILPSGQVYFHVAPANRCHIGYGDVCITPPASASAYSHFNIGEVECDDGSFLHCGPLTCGPDHAGILGLDERAARDWYASKALQWANVTVRPGRFGPWGCGGILPDVTEELIVRLRGGGVSGDWRGDRDGLELIAVLAVNAPGFTVQRALAASASPVRVPAPMAMLQTNGDRITLITMPVAHPSAAHAVTAAGSACLCGKAVSEELRLARENNRMLRSIYRLDAGPREKARLAAKLRG